MSNLELIDNYLADRLTDADKVAFEKRLTTDQSLKQEFEFQQDIVHSIQIERKAELKAMLNEIPVSGGASSTFSSLGKIALAVVGTALIMTGIYFFSADSTEAQRDILPEEPAVAQEEVEQPGKFIPENTKETEDISTYEEDTEQPQEEVVNEESELQEPLNEAKDEVDRVQQPAEIKTPTLIEDFGKEKSNSEIKEPEVYTETEDFSAERLSDSNIEVVTDNSQRKYKFHYRFNDDKLYLYGDFSKELYEILEFNTSKGTTVYLYYDDNYYLIDKSQGEITKLEPLENADLKMKLDRLRN